MLPNTPVADTAVDASLISPDQYSIFTGDRVPTVADIQAAIDDATEMLSEECKRTFAYGTYKENLYLYKMGMVFPSATPIDHTKPITSSDVIYNPATDNQAGEGSIIQGAGIWIGWFTPLPWMPVWTGVIPPQTNIEYSGGYFPYRYSGDSPVMSTATAPSKLARAIAKVAYYLLHPVMLGGMPGGTTNMSIGGVGIGGDLSSMMDRDADLRKFIARWTHPQARAWDT